MIKFEIRSREMIGLVGEDVVLCGRWRCDIIFPSDGQRWNEMTKAVSNCSGYFVSNRFTLGADGVFGFPFSQLTMVKIAVKRRSGKFISWGGWSDFGASSFAL